MNLAVIGTGHVGLVSALAFASQGHHVIGLDEDAVKVAQIERGTPPFFEPGLAELLHEQQRAGRFAVTSDPETAIGSADVAFICVGTPETATGEANMMAVENAAKLVAKHASQRMLVVEKSTVPSGTAPMIQRVFDRARPDLVGHLEVASNPEFLREGSAVHDALFPARLVLGADSEWARHTLRRVYSTYVERGVPVFESDIATAELSKHVCNAFLAMKISFINAVARICERSGADVSAIADVMGSDERIGRAFLNAGLGYGGSCFPKDLRAFERLSESLGYEFNLLAEIRRINDEAIEAALEKTRQAVWNLTGKRIALLGLSYKPGTDDVRFSPAVQLARRLVEEGARPVAYDPQVDPASVDVDGLEFASDPLAATRSAYALILCTEWEEFAELDLQQVAAVMTEPVLVDGRNFFDPEEVADAGLNYYPTGRPSAHP